MSTVEAVVYPDAGVVENEKGLLLQYFRTFELLHGDNYLQENPGVVIDTISVAEFWQKVFPDKDGQSISERTKYLRFQNGKVFPDKDGDNYLQENPGVVIDTISVAEFGQKVPFENQQRLLKEKNGRVFQRFAR